LGPKGRGERLGEKAIEDDKEVDQDGELLSLTEDDKRDGVQFELPRHDSSLSGETSPNGGGDLEKGERADDNKGDDGDDDRKRHLGKCTPSGAA